MFATAPEYQGCGCGSALLQFLGEVADTDGVVGYLETAGNRNTSFYANKGGYQEIERSPVASFKNEGGGVAMIRPFPCNTKPAKSQSVRQGVPTAQM